MFLGRNDEEAHSCAQIATRTAPHATAETAAGGQAVTHTEQQEWFTKKV